MSGQQVTARRRPAGGRLTGPAVLGFDHPVIGKYEVPARREAASGWT